MAFETSIDLIRQLQIALRKEAGVSSYDPDDPALLDLPSLGEAIAEADPSPPYLRCKQCHGRLLRGLQSLVCVFCGAQQRKEIPPDPIPFKSTIGYRWLLESLDLTGSEAVTGNVATERLSASKDSFILSDLFDFELKWHSKPEKNGICITEKAYNQSETSSNLAGVDLDSFFSESKKDIVHGMSDDKSIPKRKISDTENYAFPSQESLSLFENAQPPALAERSGHSEGFIDDSFSGWESEFQSASSQTHEISSSADATSGSFSDVTFINIAKDDDKARNDSVAPLSVTDSWIHSDQRYNTNTGVSYDSEQFKTNAEVCINGKGMVNSNNPSVNDNWIPDELWPVGITKEFNPQEINEDDDSFDAWQDFTSSANVPGLVDEHRLKTNLVNSRDSFQEKEVGSVVGPDIFSGPFTLHNVSADSNSNADSSISSREEEKSGGTAAIGVNSDENADAALQSRAAEDAAVEMLMSQMHDLSFMLEPELSIPQKIDGFDTIS